MSNHNNPSRAKCYFATAALLLGLVSGCALLGKEDSSSPSISDELDKIFQNDSSKSESSSDPSSDHPVVNPPAKTIRFDGREIVLGTADVTPIATAPFCSKVQSLLDQEKYFSATRLIHSHTDVAEQAIWERYVDDSDEQLIRFIAKVLSEEVSPTISWDSTLVCFRNNPIDARTYHQARTKFAVQLKSEDPSQEDADQLKTIAQKLNHPLVMLDALRLLALRELVAGRHAWAESLFLQATRIAEQHGDQARLAELWLMAATTANRSERQSEAARAWEKATATYANLHLESGRPLNAGFWRRADEQRPGNAQWPDQLSQALVGYCQSVGCELTADSPSQLVLWCAVAAAQYEDSQHQVALVNFKKAETFASGDDVMWLRISQSKCLAALGQSHAAAALLSGPAASNHPTIAIASTAAIGSAKLHAGAYQQGIQLLNKALSDERAPNWPDRSRSEADLALARLILGETEQGLEALHSAQKTFESLGDRASLLQALENEVRLLDHEQRKQESARLQLRIREIEKA